MKTYEGMFLLDAGQSNFEEAVAPINNVMQRNNGEIVVMKKWDERRLAYEIAGRRRGLYVLTYFKAEPEAIKAIERDVQLSDEIMRVLILSADHLSEDAMKAPVPAENVEARTEATDAAKAPAAEAAKPAAADDKKAEATSEAPAATAVAEADDDENSEKADDAS